MENLDDKQKEIVEELMSLGTISLNISNTDSRLEDIKKELRLEQNSPAHASDLYVGIRPVPYPWCSWELHYVIRRGRADDDGLDLLTYSRADFLKLGNVQFNRALELAILQKFQLLSSCLKKIAAEQFEEN